MQSIATKNNPSYNEKDPWGINKAIRTRRADINEMKLF